MPPDIFIVGTILMLVIPVLYTIDRVRTFIDKLGHQFKWCECCGD